ncbi:unnamed protein product [Anisakis simplex]|uniref:Nephrin (inferred by orthology to a human protein) n=1 Tax=Anisakis simplex TaxID=6269 RepID=A0A158PMR6_ANISI|nr:unnamed protein product [Anisakis simplex]
MLLLFRQFHSSYCNSFDSIFSLLSSASTLIHCTNGSTAAVITLLVLSSCTASSAKSESSSPFVIRPKSEPYYVSNGEQGVVLECSFAPEYLNKSRYESSWTAVTDDIPRHLTRNELSFMKDKYDLMVSADLAQYNLRIKRVELERDNAKFYCTILDKETGSQKSCAATVVVVVPPEKPTIRAQPSNAVRENELVSLECESLSGNPPPKFEWIFANGTRVPDSWYQQSRRNSNNHNGSSARARSSQSLLQWRVGAHDNDAYLSCRVWNEALPKDDHSKSVSTNRLNVLYGPRVRAGPVREYNVEEGDKVELICSADGNPPPTQFEWYHVATGERYPAATWKFTAEKRLSGEFRCTALNSVESGVDKLKLNVMYGPILDVKEMVTPAEGDRITLECSVDSNPGTENVIWIDPNGGTHKGARFTIDHIEKRHSGNYTCAATNTLTTFNAKTGTNSQQIRRSAEAITRINVLRRPGRAIISATSSAILVGQHVRLTCRADDAGSPEATYLWATPGSGGTYEDANSNNGEGNDSSSIFLVEHATLADNGEYRCVPKNRIGRGEEGVFILQVVEPAKIVRALPANRIFNAGEVSSAVAISCEAQGYPAPSVSWLKDGQELNTNDEMHCCSKSDYCSIAVQSTLKFMEPLAWNDKGNYSCLADNFNDLDSNKKIDSDMKQKRNYLISSSSILINIVHKPVILSERYPDDGLAAADLSTTAHIRCVASARPAPRFVWILGSAGLSGRNSTAMTTTREIVDEKRYSIQSRQLANRIDEYESVLSITDVTESDHSASYMCRVANGISSVADNDSSSAKGSTGEMSSDDTTTAIIFKLQSKSKPQTPRDIRLVAFSSTWLLIGWRPGFDGGVEQRFELEYRKVNPWKGSPDGSEPVSAFVTTRNATTQTLYWQDISSDSHRNANEIRSPESALQSNDRLYSRQRRSMKSAEFIVYNMADLMPKSGYWFRLRAWNGFGSSDWTPISTATTADATESELLPKPMLLDYDTDEGTIHFQSVRNITPSDERKQQSLCLMLFVSSQRNLAQNSVSDLWMSRNGVVNAHDESHRRSGSGMTDDRSWRAVDCYPIESSASSITSAIKNIEPAERFAARLCYQNDVSLCSHSSNVLVQAASSLLGGSSAALWKYAIPVGVCVLIVLLCILLLVILCCRSRQRRFSGKHEEPTKKSSSQKTTATTATYLSSSDERRTVANGCCATGGKLPESETKNTIVHGSQTDSGIFTLGSLPATGNNASNNNNNQSMINNSVSNYSNINHQQQASQRINSTSPNDETNSVTKKSTNATTNSNDAICVALINQQHSFNNPFYNQQHQQRYNTISPEGDGAGHVDGPGCAVDNWCTTTDDMMYDAYVNGDGYVCDGNYASDIHHQQFMAPFYDGFSFNHHAAVRPANGGVMMLDGRSQMLISPQQLPLQFQTQPQIHTSSSLSAATATTTASTTLLIDQAEASNGMMMIRPESDENIDDADDNSIINATLNDNDLSLSFANANNNRSRRVMREIIV